MALGGLSVPLLAILGFFGACGTVVYGVSAPALVPALVARKELPAANGRIELARTAALAAGPALGGVLVGWTGGSPAFALAAALSLCAVVLLAGINEPPRDLSSRRHPWRDVREGATFVLRHRLLRPIFVTQFVFNIALFVILAIYVPYAIRALGLSAAGVGVTLSALGAGMVVGAIFAARIMRRLAMGTVIAIGPIAGFLASLLMVATIWVPSPVLAGCSFFLMGVGPILWVVSTTTLRQTITPQNLLGRVSAINTLATGARPVGAAIGAVVGELSGAEACLFVAAIGFLAQAVVILMSPVPRLRTEIAADVQPATWQDFTDPAAGVLPASHQRC
jgi:predicted MFS family arabinose efflux permease